MLGCIAGKCTGLDRVTGAEHAHVRQRSHEREVLDRVMRVAQVAVAESASNTHDCDRAIVVADVVADLFEAPDSREVGDGIDEDLVAERGETSRDTEHCLLGYSGVEEPVREPIGEFLDHTEAQVAHDEEDCGILLGEDSQFRDESIPHQLNSSRAASSCSAFGDR